MGREREKWEDKIEAEQKRQDIQGKYHTKDYLGNCKNHTNDYFFFFF